ncbi:hypothetical protein EMA8858_03027 [Emticicia aquatica]|uniref:DUF4412 domain-containing protein n=1 Tax=Emticicia aquatica TaxID=1681835 RepID=A0ABM9ASE0_9BACT|nr:hypothetical protein [Emticicia aquatica]CAH0996892.1 hypothetical protein EMA8858_03027 [Emticicia aquatica]
MKKIFLLLFFVVFTSQAQQFYRIKADVSIKDKLSNGSFRLTVGKVYYDKTNLKVVYKLTFPQQETIIIKDTTLFKISKDSVISQTVMAANEFSIFHLSLSGKLADYGINAGNAAKIYKISKVEKDKDGRVITTWSVVEKQLMETLGKIKMANVNKRLDAIAFYDVNEKLLSQQFFKEYANINGVEFPKQVTQISYNTDGTQNIQQTTYKNIIIDQEDENSIYNYPIPTIKPLIKQANKSPK